MIELHGAPKQKFHPAIHRIAVWAAGSRQRLRFIAGLLFSCRIKSQYRESVLPNARLEGVADELSDVRSDLDLVFDSEDIGNNRGDLLECIVATVRLGHVRNSNIRFGCRVMDRGCHLGDETHDMDIGHLERVNRFVTLFECKANLNNFLSWVSQHESVIGPESARNKVCYMKRVYWEVVFAGYVAEVAFVTPLSGRALERSIEKVHAIGPEIMVFGLDVLISWWSGST